MELRCMLEALEPEDLFPVWLWIDGLQERGEIPLEDALRWKTEVCGLMELWGLEPDEVVPLLVDGRDATAMVH